MMPKRSTSSEVGLPIAIVVLEIVLMTWLIFLRDGI